jgi:signal transduction histidine kinase
MSCGLALTTSKSSDQTEAIQNSLNLLDRCTSEVRALSHLLHPPLLEEMGLGSAIPWHVQSFTDQSGINVELDVPPQFERLPQPVETVLFRVLQESLTNIQRHSQSKQAKIKLRINRGSVMLAIEDRGKGFSNGNGHPPKSGVGIAGMRERVRERGGELQITSSRSGTKVEVSVPLQKEAGWQNVSSS